VSSENGTQCVSRLSEDDVALRHGHAEVLAVPGDQRLRILRAEEDAPDSRDAFHYRTVAS